MTSTREDTHEHHRHISSTSPRPRRPLGGVRRRAQPLVFGLIRALAKKFGLMVQRATPAGRVGEPGDGHRIAVKLGEDGKILKRHLVRQSLDGGSRVTRQPGGGQGSVHLWALQAVD